MIRFQLGLSDKHVKMFLNRLGADKKKYITKREFLARFWSAYTYTEQKEEINKAILEGPEEDEKEAVEPVAKTPSSIMQSVSHNVKAANRKIQSELEQKSKALKMFENIQRTVKKELPVSVAFDKMDSRQHGFLTLRDFHLTFSRLFKFTLKNE